MSEFEAKRPRLVVAPVKCSGHLTGTENRGPAHGPPSSLPPSRESPQPTCTNKKMHVRALGLQGKRNTEDRIPTTGRREGTRLCWFWAQTQDPPARRLAGAKAPLCLASMGARPRIANGGGFDHNSRRDGQNARHSQTPPSRNDSQERPSKPKLTFRKAETAESESTPIPLTPSTPPSGGLRPSLPAKA